MSFLLKWPSMFEIDRERHDIRDAAQVMTVVRRMGRQIVMARFTSGRTRRCLHVSVRSCSRRVGRLVCSDVAPHRQC